MKNKIASDHEISNSQVSPLTRRWVRYILGFSVSVAVGLAPYLGRINIPLFTPMLALIPESLQDIAIPLSTASMSIVAVVVQWYGATKTSNQLARSYFTHVLLTCAAALVVFAAIDLFAVVHVEVPAVNRTVSFAVGLAHPHTGPCQTLSRAECIKHKLGLDETQIESYFGEFQANCTKFGLILTYVAFMTSFAGMVGLVVPQKGKHLEVKLPPMKIKKRA